VLRYVINSILNQTKIVAHSRINRYLLVGKIVSHQVHSRTIEIFPDANRMRHLCSHRTPPMHFFLLQTFSREKRENEISVGELSPLLWHILYRFRESNELAHYGEQFYRYMYYTPQYGSANTETSTGIKQTGLEK
jgi:hypothetical protein